MMCLQEYGVDLSYLRGQAYDGAENMAGSVNGVAALITAEYPLVPPQPSSCKQLPTKEAIRAAVLHSVRVLGYTKLKQKQEEVQANFLSGQEMFAILPTGYGKSLCYACLPGAFDYLSRSADNPASIVVVVSPLLAIMSH